MARVRYKWLTPLRDPKRRALDCGTSAAPAARPASADGRDGCPGLVCVTRARRLDGCVDDRRPPHRRRRRSKRCLRKAVGLHHSPTGHALSLLVERCTHGHALSAPFNREHQRVTCARMAKAYGLRRVRRACSGCSRSAGRACGALRRARPATRPAGTSIPMYTRSVLASRPLTVAVPSIAERIRTLLNNHV